MNPNLQANNPINFAYGQGLRPLTTLSFAPVLNSDLSGRSDMFIEWLNQQMLFTFYASRFTFRRSP